MSIVLSLQGCMAVGKTTAVRYLQKYAPYVHISYESNREIIEEIRTRGLKKNQYEDYLEIQKLWLMNEVRRWKNAQQYPCTVMDFGAEEIEFYTLNYPKSLGKEWEIEGPLEKELAAVRKCMPDNILFLDASEAVLRQRKEADATRSREFFEYHITHLLPLKKEWFSHKSNVDVLHVDWLGSDEVGQKVKEWVDSLYNPPLSER